MSVAVWRLDPFYARFRSTEVHGPRWPSIREQLKLGIPIGLSTMFEVTSFTFMAVLIARLGTVAVAGHQIVSNLIAILFMVPLSLGIATSVLVAQSLGAGDPKVARRGRAARVPHRHRDCDRGGGDPVAAARNDRGPVHERPRGRLDGALAARPGGRLSPVRRRPGRRGLRAPWVQRHVLAHGDLRPRVWGIGLGGGYCMSLNPSPFGPPRGPAGFWEAATVALALAAILLCILAAAVKGRNAVSR